MAVRRNTFVILIILCCKSLIETEAQCNASNPCQIKGGQSYQKPSVLESKNGSLNIELAVHMANLTYDWLHIQRRTYLGMLPGPTWHIRPGDDVNVTLVNKLEEAYSETRPMNQLREQNVTNLHTHGLHISSKSPSDNVFIKIKPGEQFLYQYHIEETHPAGTYWYHAHLHGSTMFQVQGGMAGLIIVEDATTGEAAMSSQLSSISCPINCDHEVPLLFQPTLVYADRSNLSRGFGQLQKEINDSETFRQLDLIEEGIPLEDWLQNPINNIDHFTTNGVLFPVLELKTGQRKRFRMVNAGGTRTLEVMITNINGNTPTSACKVWEIAFDGLYLDSTRKPRLGKTLLVPASKADLVVVCSQSGEYQLRSVTDDLDSCSLGSNERHNGLLVTIQVTGNIVTPADQDESLPKRPFYVSDFRNLTQSQVEGFFVIEANTKQNLNREHFSNPSHYRYKAQLGTVQEWYITNTDPEFGHPMHIHVNNFQVISYNAYTGPVSVASTSPEGVNSIVFYSQEGEVCPLQSSSYVKGSTGIFDLNKVNGSTPCQKFDLINHQQHSAKGGPGTLGYVEPGEFRDVIMIPPLSNVTVRFLAHKFTGEVVIHCHILMHEDLGMMMTTYIVDGDEDVPTFQKSGNALPGQCSAGQISSPPKRIVLLLVAVAIGKICF